MHYYFLLFLCSCGLTALIRHNALKKKILDIPNARSSHSIPMPRGGGLAFVISFLTILLILVMRQALDTVAGLTIFSSASIVALLGFFDDQYQLSAKVRLVGHCLAAALVLYYLGARLGLVVSSPSIKVLAYLAGLVYLVWFINLYNFMDGIDGLAALQTISVCLTGAVLFFWAGQFQLATLVLFLASSVAGFLVWNFPYARIFMGDVGSGFIGLLLGVCCLFSLLVSPALFYAWVILNGVFLCDASLTLLRRIYRRENVFQAHCNHVYQQAARYYGSHVVVSSAVFGINVIWLFPIAVLVQQGVWPGWLGILTSFLPLIFFGLRFSMKKPHHSICGGD